MRNLFARNGKRTDERSMAGFDPALEAQPGHSLQLRAMQEGLREDRSPVGGRTAASAPRGQPLERKGEWNLDQLTVEFEELILSAAPIEIVGFSSAEIDQIMRGDDAEGLEQGPIEPDHGSSAVARPGDIFRLGAHRVICGDATNADVLERLPEGDEPARLVLTDEPYNVRIAGNVTGGAHREFAMASGEMSDAEFLGLNLAWMKAVLPCLCDGGAFGTFIDCRGYPTVFRRSAGLPCRVHPLLT
jgi:hypothetical protein